MGGASITKGWMREENTVTDSEVEALVEKGQLKALSESLTRWANPEVADLILRMDKPHQVLVYRALPRRAGGGCVCLISSQRIRTIFLEAA